MTELLGPRDVRDIQSTQGGLHVACVAPVCGKDGVVAVSTHGLTWPCRGCLRAPPCTEQVSDPDIPALPPPSLVPPPHHSAPLTSIPGSF